MPPKGGITLKRASLEECSGTFWNELFSFLASLVVAQDFEVFIIQHSAFLCVLYFTITKEKAMRLGSAGTASEPHLTASVICLEMIWHPTALPRDSPVRRNLSPVLPPALPSGLPAFVHAGPATHPACSALLRSGAVPPPAGGLSSTPLAPPQQGPASTSPASASQALYWD